MKTAEDLNALKEEVEALNEKLHELTEEELAQVTGGEGAVTLCWCPECGGLLKQRIEYIEPYPVYECTVCHKTFVERPQPVT